MSLFDDTSCGCGPLPHPAPPDIPAGLPDLAARQAAGFPEYRHAMLAAIPRQPALAGWRARGHGDLGVMLLESWAYVLDVTGFYDARVAEQTYLGTARGEAAARRITALLGHRARGAVAARVTLAFEAEGAEAVTLPKGTAFRSDAFDGEAPQVFELDAATVIWPQRNRWRLAPVRLPEFDGTLRFAARGAPPAGSVILVRAGSDARAARVVKVEADTGQDGETYSRLVLEDGAAVAALAGARLNELAVSILRLPLAPNGFDIGDRGTDDDGMSISGLEGREGSRDGRRTSLNLDALYPQVRPGAWAAIELDGVFHPVLVTEVGREMVVVDNDSALTVKPKMAATKVTFTPAISYSSGQSWTFHADPLVLGAPTRAAKTRIALADILHSGALVPPVAPLAEAPATGEVIAVGAREQGALLSATVVELGEGAARLQAAAGTTLDEPLVAPVDVLGNLGEAIRGESVVDEVLGSANAAEPFNSFTLKKKPLVWRDDAAQAGGRSPDLAVRVAGIEWLRVDSFFGRRADDEVFVVRQQPDGGTRIIFGDGKRGARPPSGVDNVRADYRFGAGAASPPAGAISQVKTPVKGLATVRGPLPAAGGADPESAEELRTAAPAFALTLGRAVSLADFEALARSYGVANAAAGWMWDERRQRAAVKLWIISAGASTADSLAAWLAAQATPDLVIAVEEAEPANFASLAISLAINPRHDPATVRDAARAALFDRANGLLSPTRQKIGAPLFRSALVHRVHQVRGVASVTAVLLDGIAMPRAVAAGAGRWFDLAGGTSIS